MSSASQTETFYCHNCGQPIKGHERFCHHCGNYLGFDGMQVSLYSNPNLQSAFYFFSIYLAVCLLVHLTSFFDDYSRLFWVEVFLALTTLAYVRLNLNSLKPVLRFKNFTVWRVVACVATAAVLSTIVNLIVSKMNFSFFGTEGSYYDHYSIYTMPALIMVYSIALNPAIFEELAFRGVIYNYLNNVLDEKLVVIVTAFMFAIVHLSLMSLFWLVPFGILVGTIRRKTGTVWYGVIFHFTFNLIAVLFDLYKNGYFN